MAKRRKRTNKKVPAKGRLRDMADRLWSLAVKYDWAQKCAVCGRRENLNAHHLVPREHNATRYERTNGICLCAHCHQWDKDISPHQNAAGWLEWLREHHTELWIWYIENPRPKFDGTTNAAYYIEQIRNLWECVEPHEFESIVGVRFATYLTEGDE